ncbi:MAG: hypothetical protein ABI450_10800 [Rhizomicrobium sp.]
MPQAKRTSDGASAGDGQHKQGEVCGYIFDLLGSLEAIAAQHKLPVLARLIAMANSEARDCR